MIAVVHWCLRVETGKRHWQALCQTVYQLGHLMETGVVLGQQLILQYNPDGGEGSFSELANFPETPGAGAWVDMPDIEGEDGAARAYYIRLLPLYMMETRRVQLCMQQKLHYLEIAHRCRAIFRLRTGAAQSQDCVNPVSNLEIGTQFRDSEYAHAQSRDCTNS